jgi:DNA topoisomerase I
MTYIGLIVESPSKCGKIEGYLGDDYKCIASYGHLREIKHLKDIHLKSFKIKYSIIDKKREQINKLKSFIKNASEIVLATDDDREGEAIAWHICDMFNLSIKDTKRIIFNEITKEALNKSVLSPIRINMNIVNAQQSRQILDMLVGYKITPVLWSKLSYNTKKKLSAGRCQTPALRIIYDNERKIENTPLDKQYETIGYFTSKNIEFKLNTHFKKEDEIVDFLNKSIEYKHTYNGYDIHKINNIPPQPFTTSILQQKSSNTFKYSPKITMSISQKLYEEGYITYMRTDSKTYSNEFVNKCIDYIKNEYGDEYVNNNIFKLLERNGGDNCQEAHEAIRPTNIFLKETDIHNLDNRHLKLYKLIRDNTLQSCMSESIMEVLKASIISPLKNKYIYNSEIVLFPGWKIVSGYKDNKYHSYLKSIKNNTELKYKNVISKITLTGKKMRYSEAKLVKKLESNGIGRPSTYSSLVDKIQERGYVKKMNIEGKKIQCTDYELVKNKINMNKVERIFGEEKNKLKIQNLGLIVIEYLIQHFNDLFNYNYTKIMEDRLDLISNGIELKTNINKDCLDNINKILQNLEVKKECVNIDENNSFIIGKYGPVIKCKENNKTTFKSVKNDIDLNKLKKGEYNVNEITNVYNEKTLGIYDKKNVLLKNGQYGYYIKWGKQNTSLKNMDINIENIKLEDVLPYLKREMIRDIDENTSIRNGKYGDYIYYKTEKMKKPKFINLKKFKEDYMNCDIELIKSWVSNN